MGGAGYTREEGHRKDHEIPRESSSCKPRDKTSGKTNGGLPINEEWIIRIEEGLIL